MKTIQVKVKTSARPRRFEELIGGTWRVKFPPVDGKANEESVDLIARHFAIGKAPVSIKAALRAVKLV